MAEQDIKIKDAPLLTKVSDAFKMPVSDGSGQPKTISVGQIRKAADERVDELELQVKESINKSTQQTDLARELNEHPWIIDEETKHIMIYDAASKSYKDSGVMGMLFPDISQDGNDMIIQY